MVFFWNKFEMFLVFFIECSQKQLEIWRVDQEVFALYVSAQKTIFHIYILKQNSFPKTIENYLKTVLKYDFWWLLSKTSNKT